MSRLIVIEGHEGQRRQLAEQLAALSKKGFALAGKLEASTAFRDWKELFASAGARGLFDVARRELEPGWHEFPSAAADTIARRLGWGFSPARFDDVLRHHSCDDAPDGCQGSGDGSVTTRARP